RSADLYRRWSSPEHEEHERQDQADHEQNPGDLACRACDSNEAAQSCDDRNDEKDHGPIKHDSPPVWPATDLLRTPPLVLGHCNRHAIAARLNFFVRCVAYNLLLCPCGTNTENEMSSLIKWFTRSFLPVAALAMVLGACAETSHTRSTGEQVDDATITAKVKT